MNNATMTDKISNYLIALTGTIAILLSGALLVVFGYKALTAELETPQLTPREQCIADGGAYETRWWGLYCTTAGEQ